MWEEKRTSVVDEPRPEQRPAGVSARVIIEDVRPEIAGGRFSIKRVVGEEVRVTADVFADGHDALSAVLRWRQEDSSAWQEVPMAPVGGDCWEGRFAVSELGRYEYTLEAWVDRFSTWQQGLAKKVSSRHDVSAELLEGADLVREAAQRAGGAHAIWLREQAEFLGQAADLITRSQKALDPALRSVMAQYPDRSRAVSYDRSLSVVVDRERARYGAWYEVFPRSCAFEPGRHGTLNDCARRLPYVASMGFDVVYLPPIHPIGKSFRKGPNNTLNAGPNDPGSPWAIGSAEGGHKSVHPQLGTLADFDRLVAVARDLGLEIALDVAFQCSPDHPYVREHPDWFRHRPDGSIKYAENPPKKYQDIYPLDFECSDWRSLWDELLDVVLFWISHGVRIFRVDNPHTKPFRFWERLIRTVQEQYAETIFLGEAFTRPKVMRYLAKAGFSQSYTYFTWRNTKSELTDYLTELTRSDVREYVRPNLFANTPDILSEYLQFGGRPAFAIRLILAATLGASYGICGPSFELCENRAAAPGSEEYQDSEKYQVRFWDWDRQDSLRDLIARVNEIRRDNPALRANDRLCFHATDNDQILCYSKTSPELTHVIVTVVNLDPHHKQSGRVCLPLGDLGLGSTGVYQAHDLISDARFLWRGESNPVEIDPGVCPAFIFRLRKKVRTERDFDYYF
jgi:starch synthase (maltosyl-transferring)